MFDKYLTDGYTLKMLNLLLAIFSTCILGILLVSYFFLNSDLDKKEEEERKANRKKQSTATTTAENAKERKFGRKKLQSGSVTDTTRSSVEEVVDAENNNGESTTGGTEVLRQLREQVTRLELELSKENLKVMKLELELKEEKMNTQHLIKNSISELGTKIEKIVADSHNVTGQKMDMVVAQNQKLLLEICGSSSVGNVTSSIQGSGSESGGVTSQDAVTSRVEGVEKSDGF